MEKTVSGNNFYNTFIAGPGMRNFAITWKRQQFFTVTRHSE